MIIEVEILEYFKLLESIHTHLGIVNVLTFSIEADRKFDFTLTGVQTHLTFVAIGDSIRGTDGLK